MKMLSMKKASNLEAFFMLDIFVERLAYSFHLMLHPMEGSCPSEGTG